MLQNILYYITALLFFVNISYAQVPTANIKSLRVTGKVIESTTGTALEFATISLYSVKDSSMIGGGLSDVPLMPRWKVCMLW